MSPYPPHLLKLIEYFKKFPGIGAKSAERLVFEMINWTEDQLHQFSVAIQETKQRLNSCSDCGALIGEIACSYCNDKNRDETKLCVVAFPKDLFLIDATRQYRGRYHVIGGVISPLDQLHLDDVRVAGLKRRIEGSFIKEIILALDSTIEGDATALYLKKALSDTGLPISRLAFGLPMGSSFDYIDGGTLTRALEGRSLF